MFYVYVLKSKLDRCLDTGYTDDLKRRFAEHNKGKNQSTKSRKPFDLLYYEAYHSQLDAQLREKDLKRSATIREVLHKQLKNSMTII